MLRVRHHFSFVFVLGLGLGLARSVVGVYECSYEDRERLARSWSEGSLRVVRAGNADTDIEPGLEQGKDTDAAAAEAGTDDKSDAKVEEDERVSSGISSATANGAKSSSGRSIEGAAGLGALDGGESAGRSNSPKRSPERSSVLVPVPVLVLVLVLMLLLRVLVRKLVLGLGLGGCQCRDGWRGRTRARARVLPRVRRLLLLLLPVSERVSERAPVLVLMLVPAELAVDRERTSMLDRGEEPEL